MRTKALAHWLVYEGENHRRMTAQYGPLAIGIAEELAATADTLREYGHDGMADEIDAAADTVDDDLDWSLAVCADVGRRLLEEVE